MNEKAMIERLLSPRTISQHMTRADLFAALELDRKEAAEMLRKVVADRDALRAELETLRMQEPIHIEEVAEIVGTAEGCALDWLVEGGPSGFPKGATLLVADGRVTDANGAGEVYLAAGAHSAVEKAARGLIDDIDGLMTESEGVAGLHLNGNLAPWNELEPGGRFERLSHLDLLRDALAAGSQSICETCDGRGVVGGFVSADSGYQDDPCPDCSRPAQSEPDGWKPIETAPKSTADGSHIHGIYILGFCPDPDLCNLESAVCVVWWEPLMNGGKGMWYGEGGYEVRPTHWRHLPAAPKEDDQ